MIILEPLLGTGLDYGALTMGANNFFQSRQYKESEGRGLSENVRRFLDVVTTDWKSNKKRRRLEEGKGVGAGGMGFRGGEESGRRVKTREAVVKKPIVRKVVSKGKGGALLAKAFI